MLQPPWSAAAAAILALAVAHPQLRRSRRTHITFSTEDDAPLTVNASAARMGPNEGKAAMIVGGAAVVLGALVGGDGGTALVVGGVGFGLFGLYIWQRGD